MMKEAKNKTEKYKDKLYDLTKTSVPRNVKTMIDRYDHEVLKASDDLKIVDQNTMKIINDVGRNPTEALRKAKPLDMDSKFENFKGDREIEDLIKKPVERSEKKLFQSMLGLPRPENFNETSYISRFRVNVPK